MSTNFTSTPTAAELIEAASRAAYWNNAVRRNNDLLASAYSAAIQYGISEDTMTDLIDAAWRGRTSSKKRYIEEAHKIINAA